MHLTTKTHPFLFVCNTNENFFFLEQDKPINRKSLKYSLQPEVVLFHAFLAIVVFCHYSCKAPWLW